MQHQQYRPLSFLFMTLVLVSGLTACGAPEGDADNGARWFAMHNCVACHGENGKNGRAAELAGIGRGFGSFVNYLRDPDVPSMPRFSEEKLSEQDAADIYIWLKSIPE